MSRKILSLIIFAVVIFLWIQTIGLNFTSVNFTKDYSHVLSLSNLHREPKIPPNFTRC